MIFFSFIAAILSRWDFAHGKFGLSSPGKASCDRAALPNLQCMRPHSLRQIISLYVPYTQTNNQSIRHLHSGKREVDTSPSLRQTTSLYVTFTPANNQYIRHLHSSKQPVCTSPSLQQTTNLYVTFTPSNNQCIRHLHSDNQCIRHLHSDNQCIRHLHSGKQPVYTSPSLRQTTSVYVTFTPANYHSNRHLHSDKQPV